MKVLVIGGVAAGTKVAAKLKREDRGLDVALITKDQDISYAGCGLPYYVGGMIESRDELIVNTRLLPAFRCLPVVRLWSWTAERSW